MKRWLNLIIACFLIWTGAAPAGAEETSDQLIIINKAVNKLAFYEQGKQVKVFSVGTGRKQTYTPEGTFKIVNKIKNRPYYTGKIPGGDPRNPLGDRWLGLDARGAKGSIYGIHGNNNEKSIGKYVSSGCVRMHNHEVRWLFDRVKIHTPVIITHSKLSFAELAKAHHYALQPEAPLEKVDIFLTLLAETKLFQTPGAKPTPYALAPQTVQAFEKKGDWYRVKTWFGDAWLTSQRMIAGEITPVEKTILLDRTLPIQQWPLSGSPVLGTLSPQPVTAFEQWEDWYHIRTWLGDAWIQVKNAPVQVPFELVAPDQMTEEMIAWAEENQSAEMPVIGEWDGETYLLMAGKKLTGILETNHEIILQTQPGDDYTLAKIKGWKKDKKMIVVNAL